MIIGAFFLIYYFGFQLKYLTMIKLKGDIKIFFVLPIVKLFMDIGTLLGDISFLSNRNWNSVLNEYKR